MRGFAVLTAILLGPVSAQTLSESIDRILQASEAQRGVWGIHVIDVATGATVYERNARVPMTPASNTKLFSTSLALARLGPNHVFRTRVFAGVRPDAAGVVRGDLSLVAGGDPTLSARPIPYRKGPVEGDALAALRDLAGQVAARGARRIEGDLIADDTVYPWAPYPEGWTVDDTQWEYGAPVSAFVLNDNAFQLTLRAAKEAGGAVAVSLSPPVEYYTIDNRIRVVAGGKREVKISRMAGSRMLRLTGTLPPGAASSALLAIDDPAWYAGLVFRRLLAEAGVTVNGRIVVRHRDAGLPYEEPAGELLAERQSPPLIEMLTVINKTSQNLHAEVVLREVARVRRGDGTTGLGLEELEDFLKEIGAEAQLHDLMDGSGLSRRGLAAPAVVAKLLVFLHQSPWRDDFYRTLPVAGEDGTLERRFRGLGEVSALRAKTGSISHVNALSGYAGADPARRYAFAIMANHTTAPSFDIRAVIDKIGKELLAELSR